MPNSEQIAKGLTILAANFNVRIAESTMELWKLEFHETDDDLFRSAVSSVLEDEDVKRIPTLGQFKRILRDVEASKISDLFSRYDCPKCDGYGMFYRDGQDGYPGAMVICMCAFGQKKTEWLELERKAGRAVVSKRR